MADKSGSNPITRTCMQRGNVPADARAVLESVNRLPELLVSVLRIGNYAEDTTPSPGSPSNPSQLLVAISLPERSYETHFSGFEPARARERVKHKQPD